MNKKKAQLKIQALKNQRFLVPSSSKAQLKIQEMAFMLLGLVLLFAIVGLFGSQIVFSNLQKNADQISKEKTQSALFYLAKTPELRCGVEKSGCVDADKLIGLKEFKEYKEFWPFSSLKIVKESGFNKKESELIECDINTYPNCDLFTIYEDDNENEDKDIVSTYVALCRREYENGKNYNKCEVAQIRANPLLKNEIKSTT